MFDFVRMCVRVFLLRELLVAPRLTVLDIVTRIENEFKISFVFSFGMFHNILRRMERDKLVASFEQKGVEENRLLTYYSITKEGCDFLRKANRLK